MVKKRRASAVILIRISIISTAAGALLDYFSLSALMPAFFLLSAVVYFFILMIISEVYLSVGNEIVIKKGWVFKRIYRFRKDDIRAVSVYKTPIEGLFGIASVKVYLKGFSVTVPFCDYKALGEIAWL
ncbi:MAG: PH domain-containing protein [Oscillospiraceae bacterium]|nr:PH domain-containing protein [Oscillospiraceae bacterium]